MHDEGPILDGPMHDPSGGCLLQVRAVLAASLVYWPGRRAFPAEGDQASRGSVSCYAWGDDYHDRFGDLLRQLAHWMHQRAGGTGRWRATWGGKTLSLPPVVDLHGIQTGRAHAPVPGAGGSRERREVVG
jgi:hypothetical protein